MDQKLDLLIDIMGAQQKLLQSLVHKSNEQSEALRCALSKAATVDQSVQTESVAMDSAKKPHIIPSLLQSPFMNYPPIPESQSVGNTNSNSNGNTSNLSSGHCSGNNNNNNNSNHIPVPYEALLKLVLAAADNKVQPQQTLQIPQQTTQSVAVHPTNHAMHPPATPPPQLPHSQPPPPHAHFQYAYHQNHQANNHLNHRVHHEMSAVHHEMPQQAQHGADSAMDCNSTLHFSDC